MLRIPHAIVDGKRWCPQCEEFLPFGYFYSNKHRVDGLSSWCRVCNQKRMREWHQRDYAINADAIKAKKRARAAEEYKINPEKFRQRARDERRTYKEAVFDYYGRVCACCGESNEIFLTVDHVNGDGASHRRALGNRMTLYRWLCKNRMPEGFQTLCRNCNFAKGQLSHCPCQDTDYSKFIGACG
jgi:hypothetical protein